MNAPHNPATVAGQLRVGTGFTQDERPGIVEQLSSLDTRLSTHPAAETDMELSIKDRDRPGQTVVACHVDGTGVLPRPRDHLAAW